MCKNGILVFQVGGVHKLNLYQYTNTNLVQINV